MLAYSFVIAFSQEELTQRICCRCTFLICIESLFDELGAAEECVGHFIFGQVVTFAGVYRFETQ